MKIASKIGKESSITFTGLVYGNINRYIYTAILARWVGPEFLGIYSLANAIILIAEVVAKMGIETGVLRFISRLNISKDLNQIQRLIFSSLKMSVLSSIIIMIFLIALSEIISIDILNSTPLLTKAIIVFSIALPFNVITLISAHATQGFKLLKYKSIVTQFINPSVLLFSTIIIFNFFNKEAVILAPMLITAIIGFFSMSFFLKKISGANLFYFNQGSFNYDLLKFSIPLMFVTVLQTFMHWMDILMLGYFTDTETVGLYHPAVRTAGLLQSLLISFLGIYSPLISQFYEEKNIMNMDSIYKMVTRWIVMGSLPIAIIFLFFSKQLMMLFGQEYIASAPILMVLTIATFFQAVFGAAAPTLSMTGFTKLVLLNTFVAFLLNFFLNIFLIPNYGSIGAAFSTLISLFLIGIARVLQVRIILKLNLLSIKLIKPIIAGLLTSVLLFQIRPYILAFDSLIIIMIASVLSIIVYAIILWLMRFDQDDLDFLKGLDVIKKKIKGK